MTSDFYRNYRDGLLGVIRSMRRTGNLQDLKRYQFKLAVLRELHEAGSKLA